MDFRTVRGEAQSSRSPIRCQACPAHFFAAPITNNLNRSGLTVDFERYLVSLRVPDRSAPDGDAIDEQLHILVNGIHINPGLLAFLSGEASKECIASLPKPPKSTKIFFPTHA